MISFYFVILSFSVCLLATFVEGSSSSSPEICQALLPSSQKTSALQKYKSGAAPMLFWHVQKAGGSSFCDMNMHELRSRNLTADRGDNCNDGTWKNYLDGHFDKPKVRGKMIGLEPAYAFIGGFPSSYHAIMGKNLHFDSKSKKSKEPAFWTALPHVLGIRHPLDSALSAFTYEFAFYKGSILGSCIKWSKLHPTANSLASSSSIYNNAAEKHVEKCMLMAMEVKDGIKEYEEIWGDYQRNKIRSHVLGNFLVDHLSVGGNLEEAKANLRRFSMVFDITMGRITTHLARCVLGWSHVTSVAHANHLEKRSNKRRISFSSLEQQLTPTTRDRMRQYQQKDLELYAYALQLITSHYHEAIVS